MVLSQSKETIKVQNTLKKSHPYLLLQLKRNENILSNTVMNPKPKVKSSQLTSIAEGVMIRRELWCFFDLKDANFAIHIVLLIWSFRWDYCWGFDLFLDEHSGRICSFCFLVAHVHMHPLLLGSETLLLRLLNNGWLKQIAIFNEALLLDELTISRTQAFCWY
jgi:hypothetical protein